MLLIAVAPVGLSWVMGFRIGFMNHFSVRPSPLVPLVYIITAAVLITTIRDLDTPAAAW